jgi:hypothetical protein
MLCKLVLIISHHVNQVKSRRHVLGAKFKYISGCNYNRRASVHWLLEVTRGFPSDDLVTVVDMCQLLELVCPDFSRGLVREASHSVTSTSVDAQSINDVFLFNDLVHAVMFHLLFCEWLSSVQTIFESDQSHTIDTLSDKIDHIHQTLPLAIARPSPIIILSSLDCLRATCSSDRATFLQLKQVLVLSPATRKFISTL